MLILHLLQPIFPSTVSRAIWGFTSWSNISLEELFHRNVVTDCHKTCGMPKGSLLDGFSVTASNI